MNENYRKVVIIYIIVTLILLLCTSIYSIISVNKLEELNKRIDNLNQLRQDSSLIEVNGELIDSDDYYQADWKSYTPAKDSIE